MQSDTMPPPTRKQPGSFLIPRYYDPLEWENVIPDKENYTIEDYEKLPEGSLYQLINGALVMTPAPIVYHQRISRTLGFKLYAFVEKNALGEVFYAPIDVQFSENNVYQPDIVFIHRDREEIIGEKRIEGPPDIVIEILSPSTAYMDLREKYEVYEKCGVREYWIADPKIKKVEVFENINNKFQLNNEARETGTVSSKFLEGFTVELEIIF